MESNETPGPSAIAEAVLQDVVRRRYVSDSSTGLEERLSSIFPNVQYVMEQ